MYIGHRLRRRYLVFSWDLDVIPVWPPPVTRRLYRSAGCWNDVRSYLAGTASCFHRDAGRSQTRRVWWDILVKCPPNTDAHFSLWTSAAASIAQKKINDGANFPTLPLLTIAFDLSFAPPFSSPLFHLSLPSPPLPAAKRPPNSSQGVWEAHCGLYRGLRWPGLLFDSFTRSLKTLLFANWSA